LSSDIYVNVIKDWINNKIKDDLCVKNKIIEDNYWEQYNKRCRLDVV